MRKTTTRVLDRFDIECIKRSIANGIKHRLLANLYDRSRPTITMIANGKRYVTEYALKGGGSRYTDSHIRTLIHRTPGGCWLWMGAINHAGYGTLHRHGLAHRWFYVRAHGPISRGMQLDHLCKVRACVNPEHLEAVTPAENSQRGRKARLTRDIVRAIRAEYRPGYGRRSMGCMRLARKYGISVAHANAIIAGHAWRDI